MAGVAALVAASAWGLRAQTQSDGPDPQLTASALLEPTLRTGPNHTVAEAVVTPGMYHVFTITSASNVPKTDVMVNT